MSERKTNSSRQQRADARADVDPPRLTYTLFFCGTSHGTTKGLDDPEMFYIPVETYADVLGSKGIVRGASVIGGDMDELATEGCNMCLAAKKKWPTITTFNLLGFSRGAVEAIICARLLDGIAKSWGAIVNIFAMDPVPGQRRWETRYTNLPGIVKNYVAVHAWDHEKSYDVKSYTRTFTRLVPRPHRGMLSYGERELVDPLESVHDFFSRQEFDYRRRVFCSERYRLFAVRGKHSTVSGKGSVDNFITSRIVYKMARHYLSKWASILDNERLPGGLPNASLPELLSAANSSTSYNSAFRHSSMNCASISGSSRHFFEIAGGPHVNLKAFPDAVVTVQQALGMGIYPWVLLGAESESHLPGFQDIEEYARLKCAAFETWVNGRVRLKWDSIRDSKAPALELVEMKSRPPANSRNGASEMGGVDIRERWDTSSEESSVVYSAVGRDYEELDRIFDKMIRETRELYHSI
mmetsp:Transcript_3668/g.5387  ORF Transcript_3668/g.5387 Transcript_3668/m.5387 type:complete len:467 (+) Transcript_3668:67-1467(+)